MSTDGFGGAFTSSDWSAEVGADLVRAIDGRSPSDVAAAIPEWLSEPADVAGDDATMAVLLRPLADTVAMGSPAGKLDFANRPAVTRLPKSVSEVADATPNGAPAAPPPTPDHQPAMTEAPPRPPSPESPARRRGPSVALLVIVAFAIAAVVVIIAAVAAGAASATTAAVLPTPYPAVIPDLSTPIRPHPVHAT